MVRITSPLELYKNLPKTNCGDCGIPTCMAFAAAVIKQEKQLADCSHLDKDIIARYAGAIERPVNMERIREEQLQELRQRTAEIDLPARAKLLGAHSSGSSIIIQCLGRDFEVNRQGVVASQCHTHTWFSLPLLDYILHCEGMQPTGRWVPFRELKSGGKWNPLFEQRCEKPLKRIADSHSELFADLVNLFCGNSSAAYFGSDISVVLLPFPRVPLLISYWKEDEGMESKLHMFFDETAERNLPIESIFTLGTGLVRMFERIMYKHSDGKSELD